MKNKYKFSILLIFCLISLLIFYKINNKYTEILKMKSNVIYKKNDYISYSFLLNKFNNSNNYYELLPYVLKVSLKDKNYQESHRIYECYLRIMFDGKFDVNDIVKLEKPEIDYLLFILKKSAKAGDLFSKETLAVYYKKGLGVEKNLQKSDSIILTMGCSYNYAKKILTKKIDSITYYKIIAPINYKSNREN